MTAQARAGRTALWYHGWSIVAVAVLTQTAGNGLTLNAVSMFLHDWESDLHAPISQLLVALLPFSVVVSISSPFIGALADKYPARLLMSVGVAGMASLYLLISAANAVWQLWVLYGTLFPLSLGLCALATVNAVVSRWFVRRIGLALGVAALGSALSGVILPPAIAWAMPALGWRGVWGIGGLIIAFAILPLVLWIVRDRPTEREGLHYMNVAGEPGGREPDDGADAATELRWTDILGRRNFWLLVFCYTPILGLYAAVQQNMAPLAATRGFGPGAAGVLLAVFSISQVFATLLLGLASDRFGNRLPLASLSVLTTTGAVFLSFGAGLPALLAGAALVGFTGGIWTLMPTAIAAEFGGGGVGRAFGMLMFFLPISAPAPSLVAVVQEATGSYAPALMGLSLICLTGGAAVLFMRERRDTAGDIMCAAEATAA